MGKGQNRTDFLVAYHPLAFFRRVGGFSFGKRRFFGRRQVKAEFRLQLNLRKNEQKKLFSLLVLLFLRLFVFCDIARPLFTFLRYLQFLQLFVVLPADLFAVFLAVLFMVFFSDITVYLLDFLGRGFPFRCYCEQEACLLF